MEKCRAIQLVKQHTSSTTKLFTWTKEGSQAGRGKLSKYQYHHHQANISCENATAPISATFVVVAAAAQEQKHSHTRILAHTPPEKSWVLRSTASPATASITDWAFLHFPSNFSSQLLTRVHSVNLVSSHPPALVPIAYHHLVLSATHFPLCISANVTSYEKGTLLDPHQIRIINSISLVLLTKKSARFSLPCTPVTIRYTNSRGEKNPCSSPFYLLDSCVLITHFYFYPLNNHYQSCVHNSPICFCKLP